MNSFIPERIRAFGNEVTPHEISLYSGGAASYVYTLQHWLSLTIPRYYHQVYSGNFDDNTQLAFQQFATANHLTPQETIDVETWNAIEKTLAESYQINSKQKKNITLEGIADPATASSTLRSIGIHAQANEDQISSGWKLYQALSRKINKFEHLSFTNEKISLYPDLISGKPPSSAYVFNNFTNYWTVFYGAPWLGVVTNVPASMDAGDALWCSSKLYKLLRKLGQAYIKAGLGKNLSLEVMLSNPLTVLYTGRKFGGLIADRNDFSQTGMSAALELTPFHRANIQVVSEALMNADPSYRLRMGEDTTLPKFQNVIAKEKFNITPVLEPEFEKLFYQPASIKKQLLQQPAFLDRVPSQRLAEGISENAPFISSDEYALVLKELKHVSFQTELDFIIAMKDYGGLAFMLKKFTEEERSFLEALLAVDIRSFDLLGNDVTQFYDNLVSFESKILGIVALKENLAATLIQSGIDLARREIGDHLKNQLMTSLKNYAKEKLT